MTIAEIHGKISHTGENLSERMEDLLTSDIFSACYYVRPETLLLPFLHRAKGLNNEPLGRLLKEKVNRVQYLFWPRLPRSEPDVLIALELSLGHSFLILVEAKYFSSKSSSALSKDELEVAETPRDQLAREYVDLLEDSHNYFQLPKSKILGTALIYITAHRSIPEDSISESLVEIKKFLLGKEDVNLFWTSWFELHPIISKIKKPLNWERPILDDLKQLLERKRLIHFRGLSLDMIKVIPKGYIYISKVEKRPAVYRFVLAPETIKSRPFFYLSKAEIHEYRWAVPSKQLVGKIYNGGAK